jgi:hypothetical protein
VEYAQWEMECCGDGFQLDEIVEWPVEKWRNVESDIQWPFVVGPADYYHNSHASVGEKIYKLKGRIIDIKAIYYERKELIIRNQKMLVPISGKAVSMKDNYEWLKNGDKAPDDYYVTLEIIGVELDS